jgi:4-diphosphocytidyl-2-C-methyl-D-erythritol kinase
MIRPSCFEETSAPSSSDMSAFVSELRFRYTNDLLSPAFELVPEIGEALESLTSCDGVLHSAMSGSGATCFGLFQSQTLAECAARKLSDRHPDWWCVATLLGSSGFDLSKGPA